MDIRIILHVVFSRESNDGVIINFVHKDDFEDNLTNILLLFLKTGPFGNGTIFLLGNSKFICVRKHPMRLVHL